MKKLKFAIEEYLRLRRATGAINSEIARLVDFLESNAAPRPFMKDAFSARLAVARLRSRLMQAALDDHGIEGFERIEEEAR